MAYTTITDTEITSGKPVKQSLLQKIKDNGDDLNTRVAALTDDVGANTVFNQKFSFPTLPVGAAIWSWDTLSNSQLQGLSSNWIAAAGSGSWTDGSGSSNTTPDARNRFLRMYNGTYSSVNEADTSGDSTALPNSSFTGAAAAIGTGINTGQPSAAATALPSTSTTTSAGSTANHNHQWVEYRNSSNSNRSYDSDGNLYNITTPGINPGFQGISADGAYSSGIEDSFTAASADSGHTHTMSHTHNMPHTHSFDHTHTTTITGGGDSETAPIHIKQNLMFKSAYTWGEFRLIYKAPSTFNITTIDLMQIEPGGNTSTLEIDIKKGSISELRTSSTISVLTTKPSIVSDGTTEFVEADGTHPGTGSTVAPVIDGTTNAIATDDYIVMEITSKQNGNSEFFIRVIGN